MNEDLTKDQEDALGALKASRGECPSAEMLLEYGALSASDRATHRAHDHISICSRCQLVLLHSVEPATTASFGSPWFLPIAALLVLAIGATVILRPFDPIAPAAPLPESIRGTDIQPLAPIGNVEAIPEFSWQSPIKADRYRVKVTRGNDSVFFGETRELKIAPSVELFEPGVEYRWSVEAIDREGEVRMTSPPQSFTLSRRR